MLTALDTYEVAMRGTYRGSVLYNVLHAQLKVNRTATQLVTALQTFADAWKEIFRANQSDDFLWQDWQAKQVAGAGITYSTTTCRRSGGDVYGAAFGGTRTGAVTAQDWTPSFVALVIRLTTGLVGRSFNGRAFVGGWPENRTTGNVFEPTNLATIQTALNAHVAAYGQGGTNTDLAWVIFSLVTASGCRYVPALPKPVYTHVQAGNQATASTVVLAATGQSLLAPMHRRKSGVGQ